MGWGVRVGCEMESGPWVVPGVLVPRCVTCCLRRQCPWRLRLESDGAEGLVCSAAYWPCGCGHFADLPPLETGGTELLTPESGQECGGGETPSLDVQPAVTTRF